MALKDITYIQNLLKVLNVLVFVAQNCVSLFFPLFLKYLGLSVLEMSLIRAFQVIIATGITALCVYVMKLKNCRKWRAHLVCMSLLASSGACMCLAVYFQSGTKVALMRCESISNKESTFGRMKEYTDGTLNRTVNSVPTAVTEVYKAEGIQDISTIKININRETTSENVMTSTEHIPALYFYPYIPTRLPKYSNPHEDMVKHFKTIKGDDFVENQEITTTDSLPTTQSYKTWSDMQRMFTEATTSSQTTDASSKTHSEENLDYIFLPAEESPRMNTPVQKKSKNKWNSGPQGYRQKTGYGQNQDAETTSKHLQNHKDTKLGSWPLFINNNPQKYVPGIHNSQLPEPNQDLLDFHTHRKVNFPEYTKHQHKQYVSNVDEYNKAREDNWPSGLKAVTEDRSSRATSPTTVDFTVTTETSQNFVDNQFKKIMDVWKHHKSHTASNNLKGDIKNPYSENNDDKKITAPNYQKQWFPRFRLGQKRKRYAKSGTVFSQGGKHQVKKETLENEMIKVSKNVPMDQGTGTPHNQLYDENYNLFHSGINRGSRAPQRHSSRHHKSDTTTADQFAQYDLAAVPVYAHLQYSDMKEVFIVATVLAVLYELCTSIALPSVQELWRQMWGRMLPARSPLQLGAWSVCVCLVLLAAVSQPCRLQVSIHCGSAAVVFVLALLPALVALPPVARRARLDKTTLEIDFDVTEDEQLSYIRPVVKLLSGFSTACSCEFMLWHITSLESFQLDYEILFCGYVSLSALAEGTVRSWRQEREEGGGRLLGHALLGVHFLLASVMGRAWAILTVAPLSGASSALLRPTYSTGWSLGYGLGCLAGGVLASYRGTALLFRWCAVASCAWCVLIAVCWGVLRCRRNASYTHLLSTVEDYEEHDDTDSAVECEDWLERALMEEERHKS